MSMFHDSSSDLVSADPSVLESVLDELSCLKASLAERFQVLAQGLQSTAARSRSIAEVSREVAGMAGSGDSGRAIGMLQQVTSDAEKVELVAEQSGNQLRKILSQLVQSRAPLERLQKLPAQLYAIGTLARIEGTRLRAANVDISSLAADIDILAEQIERHVTEIAGEEDKLSSLVTRSAGELDAIQARERGQAAELRAQAAGVFDPLRARADASQAAVVRIDEQYDNIHRATDKIVVSLQAEDIARQRLEHVEEAVHGVVLTLQQQDSQTKSARILLLQRAQLASTRDLLSEAAGSMFQSLHAVKTRLAELATETARVATQTGEDGRSFAEAVQDGLKAISSIFVQYSSSAQTVVTTVQTVLKSVAAMTERATELGKVAFAIRRTALNAIIETSHLGKEGAAMRALGGEVQGITEQSKGDTRVVLDGLCAIKDSLAAMTDVSATSSGSAFHSADVEKVTTEVTRLSRAVEDSSGQISMKLSTLLEAAASLDSELEQACTAADNARRIATTFESLLQKLDVQIESMGGHEAARVMDETDDAAHLTSLYSMQTERDVHTQVFGKPNSQPDSHDSQSSEEQDLGDGIELF